MARTYSLGTEGRWAAHARIEYDQELARYRWIFLPSSGEYWALEQTINAVAANGAIKDAEAYLKQHGARENVFGVVFDDAQQTNFGLPAAAEIQESDQLLQDAIKSFQRGMDPNSPFRAEELAASRVDSLAALEKDPNHLWVHLFWADRAFKLGDFKVVVSEWFHAYFRVLGACRGLTALAVPRIRAHRIVNAYTRFNGLGEVARLKTILKLEPLLEAGRWQEILELGKRWPEIARWLTTSESTQLLEYVRHQIQELGALYPYGGATAPTTITTFAQKQPRTDGFHKELLAAIPFLEKILSANEAHRRSQALEALVEIADPECVAALRRTVASSGDAGWRSQLENAIVQIHKKVSAQGASWAA